MQLSTEKYEVKSASPNVDPWASPDVDTSS